MRSRVLLPIFLFVILACGAQRAHAQTQPTAGRTLTFVAGIGQATTWDDEGLLGRGMPLSAGIAWDVTPRLRLQALIDRVPYERDTSWLRFDGRVWFAGADAAYRYREGTAARPFIGGGFGILQNEGVWTRKISSGPFQPSVEEHIVLSDVLTAMVFTSGVELSFTRRLALVPQLRVYLVNVDDDLDPAIIIRPGVAVTLALR